MTLLTQQRLYKKQEGFVTIVESMRLNNASRTHQPKLLACSQDVDRQIDISESITYPGFIVSIVYDCGIVV
jgi:hypothetical protein